MKLPHVSAKPGTIAEKVLIAGDPGRIKKLSKYLQDMKVVNRNRGFLTCTGTHNGVRITLATHGIGSPSAAIVIEELAMLGAKTFVRFGTAGALVPELNMGDYVIVTEASHYPGGIHGQYFEHVDFEAKPDKELTEKLENAFASKNLKFCKGKVFSSDAFYAESHDFVSKYSALGNIAVEMECALLFKLSKMKGWRCASALVISDTLVAEAGKKHRVSDSELGKKVDEAAVAVLDALAAS